MKIYTKTGDKGKSGLIGGTRVSKSDLRLEAYGTVDELNSHIGVLVALGMPHDVATFLKNMQNLLFTVGSNLATDLSKTEIKNASVMKQEYVEQVEFEIDRMDSRLPVLMNFIIPGGSPRAAQCHVCRTVARRAERRIVEVGEQFVVESLVVMYVNRLSDYFFTLSRFLLMEDKTEEIAWQKPD